MLSASAFDKGQEVSVIVTATDGTREASGTLSATVLNTAPEAPDVGVSLPQTGPGGDLLCYLLTPSLDADDDAISYTMAWSVDGEG